MKLARTLWPNVSSSRLRWLGGLVSQALKPVRETRSAPHIHAAGQIPRCFAMKANLTAGPSRSKE